jgi:uncharacterized protein
VTELVVDGRPVAEVEVARSWAQRSRGLLGRTGIATGLVIEPANSLHTIGMRFTIEIAYVDRSGRVLAVTTMRPHRLGLPRVRSRWVIETEPGRLIEWGVHRGAIVTLGD